MNAIFLKFWKWLGEKNHAIILVILLLLFGMGVTIYFQNQQVTKYKNKYDSEVKLKNSLLDTIHLYKNEKNEWVAEKLTIQESLKNLEKINGQLSGFQKDLIKRVDELNSKYSVISAALIQTNVKIDSLLHKGSVEVDTVNKTVNYSDSSIIMLPDTTEGIVNYSITATKVIPAFPNIKPGLIINSITFPNKSFVEFHWLKNKKANYPVSFSVSNSNGYFKTANVESYAIPDIKYDGSKFEQWLAKNGKMLTYIGIGAGGMGLLKWLTK